VFSDYELTNRDLVPALKPVLEHFRAVGGDPDLLKPVLGVDPDYLRASLDEMHQHFGSIDATLPRPRHRRPRPAGAALRPHRLATNPPLLLPMRGGRLAGPLVVAGSGSRVSVSVLANSRDMLSDASTMGEQLVARLHTAMNAHDVEAFVACFAEDYDSVQPAHPDRAFRGREQVRANWSAVFTGVPDFRAELVRVNAVGDTAWSEWRWEGTQTDGGRLDMAGVIVLGVRDDLVAWARLYVEPVERAGAGIDAAVRDMTAER